MTATALGSVTTSRSALDVDWNRMAKWGLIGGLSMSFVSLVGMVESLDDRVLIEGTLSLGYLFLLWVPMVMGWVAAQETALEGMEAPRKGLRDLVAGAGAGAIAGLGLGVLIVLLDTFSLRDTMPNWSPRLFRLLTFESGIGGGILRWLAIGLGLGLCGGALHLLSSRGRRAVVNALGWVFLISILVAVVDDLLDNGPFEFIIDFLYSPKLALERVAAVVVALVAGGLSWVMSGRGEQIRERLAGLDQETQRRNSTIALAVAAVVLVVMPMFLGSLLNELLANVGLFILLALGLNIVVGLAGILDIGYVAFFAVGAYTTAVLTSPLSPRWSPEIGFWLAVPVVVVMAIVAGMLIGTPVIRMRGDYLAIVTLGFGEIVRVLFLSDWLQSTFGGAQGIRQIPGVELGFATVRGTDPKAVFYLVLVFVVFAVYLSWRLQYSRLGRAWMAIREDEQVAEAMGINTVTTKLFAFVVGAVLASFSGAIFAAKVGSVFPNSFELLVSIVILVVVIVGGMGNIPGVIVGAVVLIGVLGGPSQPGLLQEFQDFKLLIYGVLLVFMMLQKPEGLVPSKHRARELHQDEFLQDAWLKGDKPGVDDGEEVGDG
ncbi:MAG: branched-chain amino acid ABC transporter permease [Actinomycetia bacterium]|nr:branched-chain amino acid ABC transporter permease [Actinomycetes bacterium]